MPKTIIYRLPASGVANALHTELLKRKRLFIAGKRGKLCLAGYKTGFSDFNADYRIAYVKFVE